MQKWSVLFGLHLLLVVILLCQQTRGSKSTESNCWTKEAVEQETTMNSQMEVLFVPRPTPSHIRTPLSVALQLQRIFADYPVASSQLRITLLLPEQHRHFTDFIVAEYQRQTAAQWAPHSSAQLHFLWDNATVDELFPHRQMSAAAQHRFGEGRVLSARTEGKWQGRDKARQLQPNYRLAYWHYFRHLATMAQSHSLPNLVVADTSLVEVLCDLAAAFQLSHGCAPILEGEMSSFQHDRLSPPTLGRWLQLARDYSQRARAAWPHPIVWDYPSALVFAPPSFFPSSLSFLPSPGWGASSDVDSSSSSSLTLSSLLSSPSSPFASVVASLSSDPALGSAVNIFADEVRFKRVSASDFLKDDFCWDQQFQHVYLSLPDDIGEPAAADSEEEQALLEAWLDEAAHSDQPVVLISFGHGRESQVSPAIRAAAVQAILSAHASARLLVASSRWSAEFAAEHQAAVAGGRLLVRKWINQRNVLVHPAVQLFVSHCGYGSIRDAIASETPLLGFPIMVAQATHCHALRTFGGAECVMSFELAHWAAALQQQAQSMLQQPQPYINALRFLKRSAHRLGEGTHNGARWILHQLTFQPASAPLAVVPAALRLLLVVFSPILSMPPFLFLLAVVLLLFALIGFCFFSSTIKRKRSKIR